VDEVGVGGEQDEPDEDVDAGEGQRLRQDVRSRSTNCCGMLAAGAELASRA